MDLLALTCELPQANEGSELAQPHGASDVCLTQPLPKRKRTALDDFAPQHAQPGQQTLEAPRRDLDGAASAMEFAAAPRSVYAPSADMSHVHSLLPMYARPSGPPAQYCQMHYQPAQPPVQYRHVQQQPRQMAPSFVVPNALMSVQHMQQLYVSQLHGGPTQAALQNFQYHFVPQMQHGQQQLQQQQQQQQQLQQQQQAYMHMGSFNTPTMTMRCPSQQGAMMGSCAVGVASQPAPGPQLASMAGAPAQARGAQPLAQLGAAWASVDAPSGVMEAQPMGNLAHALGAPLTSGSSNAARKIKTFHRPKSPFVGISSRQDGKFKAVLIYQGQSIFIGAFAREADAVLHYDIVAAPIGKSVNDDVRADAICERFPQETASIADAVHAVNHASVRQLAKDVARVFLGTQQSTRLVPM